MRRAHWIYLSATMCAGLIDRWFFNQKLNVRWLPEAHKTCHSAIHPAFVAKLDVSEPESGRPDPLGNRPNFRFQSSPPR